ncbi:MAG: 30S ribosomal protein S2 [Planctomycetes bacterium]|nr:30S ribosomal protein S2 [Planctomycetota bacterium]
MASEFVRQLIDSGIHFGHRASRWNPKMKPYIYGKRNLIHIIDIRETVKGLLRAKKFITQVVARGDDVLFVGTKRQAREAIEKYATSVEMPFVAERWLGGTLTNFRTIRSRLARLEELEAIEADGRITEYSKKQVARITRERRKIHRNLAGIRKMTKLPGALVVIDVRREHIAVKETKVLGIPTVCLIDTDSDPDYADIPIPGNDDAMRSIDIILKHMAEAVTEGQRGRTAGDEQAAETARKRSRRATLARADDSVPQEPAVEDSEVATGEHAVEPSETPATPAVPESSP